MTRPACFLLATFVVLLGSISLASQAQTPRACESYVSGELAANILGQKVVENPRNGDYSKDQKLEWHLCQWISYYPPVAPGAPLNPAILVVSIQRHASVEAMRKNELAPQELGPKVKIERMEKFGELGAFYINNDRNTAGFVGSKGAKGMSIAIEMGLNPIPAGARQKLEKIAAKLWNEL